MIPLDEGTVATPNPLLDEIWDFREAHASGFDFDLHSIVQDLRKQQLASGRVVIMAPSRTITPNPQDESFASPREAV